MSLRLAIKKKLGARSERVKCVDLHPTEPWVLAALYSGHLFLWNYDTEALVKSFELTKNLPVRSAKFIVRKQWIVAGSDDFFIRVYNYNTMEKVKEFEAHTDYIRCLEVHPTLPYVLSCADDMQIKLWDWDKGWQNTMVFEGHGHYVMMVKINPKDTNTFASASLDRTIKVWGLTAHAPHFSLDAHERGVNCIDYYVGGDKPYLVSGADDSTVKIWDYQTKSCVQTLDGHAGNVSSVMFHPKLPVIISGSEDGTVRIWHNATYRVQTTLNYGLERAWSVSVMEGANKVAIGYDEGTVVLKVGHEMPVASMDRNGKVMWAVNNDIQVTTVRGTAKAGANDGEVLPVVPKDLGSCELFPQALLHNQNGRFVSVCGDGEYVIYTAQVLRNKDFGSALDFVWSALGTGDYAIRESTSRLRTFKNFKEAHTISPAFAAEGIFGGALLCVRGSDFVVLYDWETGRVVRRIDVSPRAVYWSDAGDLVVFACDASYFVLRYNRDAVAAALAEGGAGGDAAEGVEGAFDLLHEMTEKVRTGQWVGDCFLYNNASNRLNYYVGGEVMTVVHLDRRMYMLGYLPREERVFLLDKSRNVVSYRLLVPVLEYQTAVVRRDFDAANRILPSIPRDQANHIARFLESQGFQEEALSVATDSDLRFELAVALGRLDIAHAIMEQEVGPQDTTDAQHKWKQLGDLALARCDLALAEQCAVAARDLGGLLLLYSASGNAAGMEQLASLAREDGRCNIAFIALFLLGRIEGCLDVLIAAGRIPEAAFLARTYLPSAVTDMVALWKHDLSSVSKRLADSLADPAEYSNLFPDLAYALKAEAIFRSQRDAHVNAGQYLAARGDLDLNLIDMMRQMEAAQAAQAQQQAQQEAAAAAGAAAEAAPTAAAEATPAAAAAPAAAAEPQSAPVAAPAAAEPNAEATPGGAADDLGDLLGDGFDVASTDATAAALNSSTVSLDDLDLDGESWD